MKVQHIDHIGIVVNNFDAAKDFFVSFGFTVENEQDIEGELLDKVMGMEGCKSHVAFLVSPGEQIKLELTKFIRPENIMHSEPSQMNTVGIEHIAMWVDDLDGIIASVKDKGYEMITDIENHEDMLKVCYFRGPDGIIMELAEMLEK